MLGLTWHLGGPTLQLGDTANNCRQMNRNAEGGTPDSIKLSFTVLTDYRGR